MNGELLQNLLPADSAAGAIAPLTVAFMLLLAFFIGQIIGWVYIWTHSGLSYSQTFVASLVIMPVIIAMMMGMMAGSLAVAFGLLAVFAVVRFRSALKDTRDTIFVMWAILAGMGVGTGRFSMSVVSAVGIGLVIIYVHLISFGSRHRYDAVMGVQLSGDVRDLQSKLRGILDLHCARVHLTSQQHLGPGAVGMSFRVLMRDPARGDEFRQELEQTPGIGDVTLFMREDESEI
ncbi:MAG: DUF4956 domain-containing protein [Pirellulales bacterium]|nr:DUF4956 domain-containing protein [Pirellulales bacterium]